MVEAEIERVGTLRTLSFPGTSATARRPRARRGPNCVQFVLL